MSLAELTKIVSPAFTETVVLNIIRRKHALNNLQILEIEIDNEGSKKGDSYLSTISRFKVTASGENEGGQVQKVVVPVIVKFFHKNVPRQKTFRSADFFKTEMQFYSLVWPEMQKTKLPDEPDEIPLYLAGHVDGQNDFIALEDLSYKHFKSSGRNDDITREKLSVFLKTLANFHALGIATKLRDPSFENVASGLEESYFSDKLRGWYENFMYESMGPNYVKAAKALLPKQYQDKISELFSKDLFGETIKCCTARNKLSSVTEGDSWLPNFMFKQEEDGQLNAILIDFQLARYAPITNDLLQFLISGAPDQLLENHWDELIAEYHQYLSKRIEELSGKINYITLEEIHEQISKYPYTGVVMAMESTLMSLLKDDEVADLDILEGEEAYPLEVVWALPDFDQPRIERLAFLVKLFVDKGLI